MRLLAPFVLLIGALAAVVYLDDTAPSAELVFVNRGDVFTLDPQRMSYLQDFRMSYALYEGLVRWDNRDFSIIPAAAVDMPEISDDRLEYTFRIRDDARWSNGDPVTAHDFAFSWMRALLPDTAADYSNMLFVVDGARDFFEWRDAQLRAYMADPFDDGDDVEAETVRSMLDRINALLAATDLPKEVAVTDDAALRAQLANLRVAAEDFGDGPGLAAALASADRVRDLVAALDDEASRTVEVAWMWDATMQRFADTVGIRADDDLTLSISLAQPTAYFLDLLAFGICYPVHRPTVEGWDEDWPRDEKRGWIAVETPRFDERDLVQLSATTGRLEQRHGWARPGKLVGNGPYRLTQWRYKRDMRLERNAYYHSPEKVKSDSVVAITIEDTNTRVLAFESGQIDWLSEVGAEYQADMIAERRAYEDRYAGRIKEAIGRGLTIDEALALLPEPEEGERRNIHVFPTFGTDFYSFNCRDELSSGEYNPFSDPAVRRAFVMSVDKQAIVERVTRLREPIATTFIPLGSIVGYRSPEGLPLDPQRARDELAEAGWKIRDGVLQDESGEPFPIIDLLWTTNTPRYKWISLELKSQWERELGVRIELRGTDTKFYKEDLKLGKFMIARGRWYGDYGDPTTFLELCRTGDGNNDRGYSNLIFDDLLDRAAMEPDEDERMKLLEECERIIMDEDVPMLVLCQLVQVYMYEPGRVKGLSTHPRLTQYLWQMEVEKP